MRLPRFTIRSLLGVVIFVAIAVAALRTADDLSDGSLFGLTSLYLLTSVLLAVHRTHRRRAFWLGFALFGWTYLLASVIPPIGSMLPTTMALTCIDSKVPGRETTISAVFANTSTYSTNPVQGDVVPPQGNAVVSSHVRIVLFLDATTGKLLAGRHHRELHPHWPLSPGPIAGVPRRPSVSPSVRPGPGRQVESSERLACLTRTGSSAPD
jgi:hypothetical protein